MATVKHEEKLVGGHPKLVEVKNALVQELPASYVITIGGSPTAGRTDAQQGVLWQLGRDAAGNIVNKAQVVTHARTAVDSAHGYRWVNGVRLFMAADFLVLIDGRLSMPGDPQSLLNLFDAYQCAVANVARRIPGIECGIDWPGNLRDPPHIQVAGWKNWPYAGGPGP